jgi:Polysaccharide deacetylase
MRANASGLVGVFASLLVALEVTLLIQAGSVAIAGETTSRATGTSWSRLPPAGRRPADVPQFVALTFDDDFGLAFPGSVGGVRAIVDAYAARRNPAGRGVAADFDGAAIRATFFGTSVYVVDSSRKVLGGGFGEDQEGRNRAAWRSAVAAGHEMADHTVSHFNGGAAPVSQEHCCRARDWRVPQWKAEIASCRATLTDPSVGAREVVGFRAPFLSTNDAMFTALTSLGFTYDSSVPNCLDESEDGTNCSWPYALDWGSPDADNWARNWANVRPPISLPAIGAHPGLWEVPVTTLIVPPDWAASAYHFAAGLRQRIAARAPFPYPSLYEASTGKISGLDYTLLIDAGLTGDEMRAVLEYNLDLHLSGNRSPLVFVAHAHLYAFSTPDDNPDTPSAADREARWKGLEQFIAFALEKPDVRIVATGSLVAWMRGSVSAKP